MALIETLRALFLFLCIVALIFFIVIMAEIIYWQAIEIIGDIRDRREEKK